MDLLTDYLVNEEISQLNHEITVRFQQLETVLTVVGNAEQTRMLLQQSPLTQATFEFLNLDGELNKLVGHELTWSADTQTEIQTSCLASVEGLISAAWDKFVTFLKWCKEQISRLWKMVFNRSKSNDTAAKELEAKIRSGELIDPDIIYHGYNYQKLISHMSEFQGFATIVSNVNDIKVIGQPDATVELHLVQVKQLTDDLDAFHRTIIDDSDASTLGKSGYTKTRVLEILEWVKTASKRLSWITQTNAMLDSLLKDANKIFEDSQKDLAGDDVSESAKKHNYYTARQFEIVRQHVWNIRALTQIHDLLIRHCIHIAKAAKMQT